MSVQSTLFTINNVPIKIHVESNDPLEILKTTHLIMNHGGKAVSRPDDETIVLVNPGSSTSMVYTKFHVNWLYDSIKQHVFLDIRDYIVENRASGSQHEGSTTSNTVPNNTVKIVRCQAKEQLRSKLKSPIKGAAVPLATKKPSKPLAFAKALSDATGSKLKKPLQIVNIKDRQSSTLTITQAVHNYAKLSGTKTAPSNPMNLTLLEDFGRLCWRTPRSAFDSTGKHCALPSAALDLPTKDA